MNANKGKSQKKPLKIIMLFLIIVPFLFASVIGLVSVLSFSRNLTADMTLALEYSPTSGISALVGEYNAFLGAVAELDEFKLTAEKKPEAREKARPFMADYAENGLGVEDMLLTDDKGFIFTSYSGKYRDDELFFDPDMMSIAASPVPVSNLYEGGRFYCVKPVKREQTVIGYIIIVSNPDLLGDYISKAFPDGIMNNKGSFAVFDEIGNIVSAHGESNPSVNEMIKSGDIYHWKTNDTYSFSRNLGDRAAFVKGRQFIGVGDVSGTKWRWLAVYPVSAAESAAMGVYSAAFAVAAGMCVVNIIIMTIVIKANKSGGVAG
jgi:hypothetical protein